MGFDINCGVRLLRTNLTEADVAPVKETLAQALFDHIPVGVGSRGVIPMTATELDQALEMGMDWSLQKGKAAPPCAQNRSVGTLAQHPCMFLLVCLSVH